MTVITDPKIWPASTKYKPGQEVSVIGKRGAMILGTPCACYCLKNGWNYRITIWIDDKKFEDGPYTEEQIMVPEARVAHILVS